MPRRITVHVGSDLFWAPVHERGAVISAKRARMLRFQAGGRTVFARRVHIPARPFLRPALDAGKGPAVAAFGTTLRVQIERIARGG
ncbi:MAG TPA: hypothetical protein VM840_13640 [Actinomycetota bacterium]|nr:hypothetical protein [Actinomycetota bacterium]